MGVDEMKKAIIMVVVLLLVASGCIIIDTGADSRPPRIVRFSASPSSINTGDVSILSWQVENASSVSIDPGIPSANPIGADKVVPMVTTHYRLTATNAYGSTSAIMIVTVGATGGSTGGITGGTIDGTAGGTTGETTGGTTPASPPAPGVPLTILSFTASPASINEGDSAVLNWFTSNATGATISGVGNVAVNGSLVVYPTATTTYILEAANGYNSTSASATVSVVPRLTSPSSGYPPVIHSFTGSVSSTTGLVTLNWSTTSATSATISNGILSQPVNTSGNTTFSGGGGGSYTYTLTATNSYGNSTATTTVFVPLSTPSTPPSGSIPTASLSVSPSTIASGGEVMLSWSTSGATYSDISDGVNTMVLSSPTGSIAARPTATTTYILTARNLNGSNYASQTVTVTSTTVPFIPYIPTTFPTIKFKADATTVLRGATVHLSWTVTSADTISIDNGIGTVSASGSMDVTVWDTITYTLTASNMGNTSSQSVTIKVP
jgi:hypothetical protein